MLNVNLDISSGSKRAKYILFVGQGVVSVNVIGKLLVGLKMFSGGTEVGADEMILRRR